MNKIKYILVTIFLFFLFMTPVKADCGDLNTEIEKYLSYKEELEGLDCTNNGDEQVVIKCNDLNLKKNLVVTDLMKKRDNEKICDSQEEQVKKIIEENSDKCSEVFPDEFTDLINKILTIFYIIGPILLVVFGSLDYTKAMVSGDAKSLKKANKTFFKRLIATVLLILSPVIVNIILSFNMSSYDLSGNMYSCDYEYLIYNKDWNITSVEKQRRNNGYYNSAISSQGGQAIADAAKQIKEYIASHGYTYASANVPANLIATDSQESRTVVCATLVAAALYRANIYDVSKLNYGINSAPSTARFLRDNGWILIENVEDLQPGDILFYQKLENAYTATAVDINGEKIHTCHTDIYYGDGKKINTGGDLDKVLTNFYADTSCYSVKSKFRYAFRYPGKE